MANRIARRSNKRDSSPASGYLTQDGLHFDEVLPPVAISDYWKNRDKYSLLTVACIAIGENPQTLQTLSRSSEHSAVLIDIFKEMKCFFIEDGLIEEGDKFPVEDIILTRIGAIEMIDRLNVSNIKNFLTEPDEQQAMLTNTPPAYLDPKHPMFSEELSIAIMAWRAVLECSPDKPKKGSRKQLIENWLELHYKTMPKEAKTRITTLLNPDKNGGAPPSD
jgi:hypothetical protein